MHIDFAIIDTDKNEAEVKDLVNGIISEPIKINSITCSHYYLKIIKSLVDKSATSLSCLVDFPCGTSDLLSRKTAIEQAFKAGATSIDIVMPQNLVSNRKYDKIREDIRTISEYCNEHGLKTRYILEYRVFDHQCLKKLCEILDSFNIREVFPSTGYFLDNLADNLIASVFLHENSKDINVYCTGNSWTENHFNIIEKTGLYGVRVFSRPALQNLIKILLEKQKNTQ
jgi:deoxyribose-phosphate aldolase